MEKHQKQNSPFQHLLKPKAGGIGFVLTAMGDQLNKVLDITIYYPEGIPTFGDFLSGRIKNITVAIDVKEIEPSMVGDYVNDRAHKIQFQKWVTQLWADKNEVLENFAKQAKEASK